MNTGSPDINTERIASLTQADVEAIAESVVEREKEVLRPQLWFGLVDAGEVAQRLGVHENRVYAPADELGAIRLGAGRRRDCGSISSGWRGRSARPTQSQRWDLGGG